MPRALRRVLSLLIVACIAGVAMGCSGGTGPTTSRLDAAKVPENLRPLVPLAARWGIGDDLERADALAKSTEQERAELRGAVAAHGGEITAWLDSFGRGATMTDEAAAFMYMQLAVEELPQ